MPTIKEIRAQYPQYDDLPDGALAAKLHKAYYSDMPFGEFADKVQLFDKPKEEGLWEGLVKPTMKAIPKVVGSTVAQTVLMPGTGVKALADMAGGASLEEAARGIDETMAPYTETLTPTEQEGAANIGLAMKPFQMAGEGWGQIGRAITDGASNALPIEPILGTVGEAAAMFGLPAGAGKVRGKFKSLDQLREALANRAADTPTVPVTSVKRVMPELDQLRYEKFQNERTPPKTTFEQDAFGATDSGIAQVDATIPERLQSIMQSQMDEAVAGGEGVPDPYVPNQDVSSVPVKGSFPSVVSAGESVPEGTPYLPEGSKAIKTFYEPVNTLFSNPFGAAAKWLANTGPARKLASFFNPELAVPQGKEWMYSRQAAKGTIAVGERYAENFVNKYKSLTPEDRQAIWEQMDSGADISTLPKELQKPALEFRILDNSLGKMLVDNGLMSEETYKANAGNHIRYIYNIYQQGGDLMGGMGQKLDTKFIKSRKDMTDLDRQRLGLVKDPVQAIANSIADTHRAVGMAQHFKTIADNPNWVFEPANVTIEGKKMGIGKAQKMLDAYAEVERNGQQLNTEQTAYRNTLQGALKDAQAVNVPKDYIQVNGAQYGALDGQFVRKPIAQDIKPILDVFKTSSETTNKVVSGVVAANGLWKMKNVALNIPTAARNTISNPVQLLMSGMRPDHVITRTGQALGELWNKGKYHDEALQQGLFKTNFTTGELEDIIQVARGFDQNNWTGFLSQVQKLGKYYGKIDDVFKLAKFIDMREAGKAAPEAARQANKWGMDYSLAHPGLKVLRNSPIGAPFISYQYKIAPLIAESMAKRPWVVGSIMALPWMVQKAITKDMTDEDAKRYIESLPEYVQNKQVFLIPGAYGMNALDVSYMVPWGNWYQVADSVKDAKISKAFKQMGVASGLLPSVLYGVTTGKDLFTGKDIVSDLAKYDPKMAAWDLTKWIWQQAAPPMLTEASVAGKVSEHLQHGQTSKGLKTEGMNVWPRIGGVNIYPVDPMGKQRGERYELQNVRKALMRKMFDRNISPEERKAAMAAYRMAVQKVHKYPDEPQIKEEADDDEI